MPGMILVPLDGSALAEYALPYAITLARALDASIQLLLIMTLEAGTGAGQPVAPDVDWVRREQLEQYLAHEAKRLQDQGLAATVTVTVGDPVTELLAAAETEGVRLVVLATHGRGGLTRFWLGSVADNVLRSCRRPLLVVTPTQEQAGHQPAVALHRLVVPLDGSALAEHAIPVASELAGAVAAQVTLVRVEPWLPQRVGAVLFGVNLAVENERIHQDAESYLHAVAGRLPAPLRADTVALRGAPAEQLIDFCVREHVDVAVMTSHGRGGVRRLALGSTADRMIRAGTTVLLVPLEHD